MKRKTAASAFPTTMSVAAARTGLPVLASTDVADAVAPITPDEPDHKSVQRVARDGETHEEDEHGGELHEDERTRVERPDDTNRGETRQHCGLEGRQRDRPTDGQATEIHEELERSGRSGPTVGSADGGPGADPDCRELSLELLEQNETENDPEHRRQAKSDRLDRDTRDRAGDHVDDSRSRPVDEEVEDGDADDGVDWPVRREVRSTSPPVVGADRGVGKRVHTRRTTAESINAERDPREVRTARPFADPRDDHHSSARRPT
jgi:hypothetical protein